MSSQDWMDALFYAQNIWANLKTGGYEKWSKLVMPQKNKKGRQVGGKRYSHQTDALKGLLWEFEEEKIIRAPA